MSRVDRQALLEHNYVLSDDPQYAQATVARMHYAQNRYWESVAPCCTEERHFHILNRNPFEADCKLCGYSIPQDGDIT
eukprot:2429970-Rhodomonas_salina.2